MPSRNIIKRFTPETYYHLYNRGVAKQRIFLDAQDKQHFVAILARHLDPGNTDRKNDGTPYQKFDTELELLAYCLMGNHFHLFLYQLANPHAITDFMRAALTAYTMYFNRKYNRVGPLFQGRYKSTSITDDSYLLHISRYIHLNPRAYQTYAYSSFRYYQHAAPPPWLRPNRILALFKGTDYAQFVADYKTQHDVFEELKPFLANG